MENLVAVVTRTSDIAGYFDNLFFNHIGTIEAWIHIGMQELKIGLCAYFYVSMVLMWFNYFHHMGILEAQVTLGITIKEFFSIQPAQPLFFFHHN